MNALMIYQNTQLMHNDDLLEISQQKCNMKKKKTEYIGGMDGIQAYALCD